MDSFIKKHHNQEDVQKLLIFRDIELWKEELLGIKEEVSFFKTLLKRQQYSVEEQESVKKLVLKLDAKQLENNAFISKTTNYTLKLQGINECDNLECETFYLNDYIEFKFRVESFLSQYRKLKKNMISKINKELKKTDFI